MNHRYKTQIAQIINQPIKSSLILTLFQVEKPPDWIKIKSTLNYQVDYKVSLKKNTKPLSNNQKLSENLKQ